MVQTYSIIDFETTGLYPQKGDRITEVAIIKIQNNKIIDTFQSLVYTGVPVPYVVTRLTGISNSMLKNAPHARTVVNSIYEFTKDSILVAHNASFDRKFLLSELCRYGYSLTPDFICTLLLSRRLFKKLDNYKLDTITNHLGIKREGDAHRAYSDTRVTSELFVRINKILSDYYSLENLTLEHYLKVQQMEMKNFNLNLN